MSGGHFDYKQYMITDIADEIESVIANNNVKDEFGYSYSFKPETIEKLQYAAKYLTKAEKMVHDIDYLICGDYGEDTFNDGWTGDDEK